MYWVKFYLMRIFVAIFVSLALPASFMVYLFTGNWFGLNVYGAIYHRFETGKWN
jgi:hypothetical protein